MLPGDLWPVLPQPSRSFLTILGNGATPAMQLQINSAGIKLLTLLLAAAIGVLFGGVPIRRAERLGPTEALRHA